MARRKITVRQFYQWKPGYAAVSRFGNKNIFNRRIRNARYEIKKVLATAPLHLTKPELRFCAGSKPPRGILEIRDGESL